MNKIVNGKLISDKIKKEIKNEVCILKNKGINPKLVVILVGNDPASIFYAKSKKKSTDEIGIEYILYNLPENIKEEELLSIIDKLNHDVKVHGIMLELPLPKHINKYNVMSSISLEKDIDGINPANKGKIFINDNTNMLYPATPQSCMEIILENNINISGKNVVIIGRGETVGKPLVFLLLKYNPTITICHSKTKNIKNYTQKADIIIIAIGKPKFLKSNMIKNGSIIIDAGINKLEDGSYCGDVDFKNVKKKTKLITPVPGGVGAITTAIIFKNLIKAIHIQYKI